MTFNPEFLKPIAYINEVDPRWKTFGGIDTEGKTVQLTLERYAKPITDVVLIDTVPEEVKVHFETAKNLALYAWFVYRFVPVAELYAYIAVEFALKKRIGKKWPFRKLLEYSIEQGWLENEQFSQWKRITRERELRHAEEVEWSKHLERPEPKSPEYWNYLSILAELIPWFRNQYAHGSSSVSPWAYRTLEDCGEIINQLYRYSSVGAAANDATGG